MRRDAGNAYDDLTFVTSERSSCLLLISLAVTTLPFDRAFRKPLLVELRRSLAVTTMAFPVSSVDVDSNQQHYKMARFDVCSCFASGKTRFLIIHTYTWY